MPMNRELCGQCCLQQQSAQQAADAEALRACLSPAGCESWVCTVTACTIYATKPCFSSSQIWQGGKGGICPASMAHLLARHLVCQQLGKHLHAGQDCVALWQQVLGDGVGNICRDIQAASLSSAAQEQLRATLHPFAEGKLKGSPYNLKVGPHQSRSVRARRGWPKVEVAAKP